MGLGRRILQGLAEILPSQPELLSAMGLHPLLDISWQKKVLFFGFPHNRVRLRLATATSWHCCQLPTVRAPAVTVCEATVHGVQIQAVDWIAFHIPVGRRGSPAEEAFPCGWGREAGAKERGGRQQAKESLQASWGRAKGGLACPGGRPRGKGVLRGHLVFQQQAPRAQARAAAVKLQAMVGLLLACFCLLLELLQGPAWVGAAALGAVGCKFLCHHDCVNGEVAIALLPCGAAVFGRGLQEFWQERGRHWRLPILPILPVSLSTAQKKALVSNPKYLWHNYAPLKDI